MHHKPMRELKDPVPAEPRGFPEVSWGPCGSAALPVPYTCGVSAPVSGTGTVVIMGSSAGLLYYTILLIVSMLIDEHRLGGWE